MDVSVRGYSRNCGWTYLAKADVSEVRLPESNKWKTSGKVKVLRNKKGVTVRRSPVHLTLNGDYILDFEFTKDEIRNMFVEAFADESLTEALSLLASVSGSRVS